MLAAAAAAVSLERGAGITTSSTAEEVVDLFANNHGALLAQSLLFVISTGFFVVFLAGLRSFLGRAEGGTGVLSAAAFGAGIVWCAISLAAQAVQVALAMTSVSEVPPGLVGTMSDLMFALLTIGNVPLAVLLGATGVLSLQAKAFPAWLGWLSLVAAATHLVVAFGIVVQTGPVAPGGAVTYVAYPLMVAWVLATTIVMIRRIGNPTPAPEVVRVGQHSG
jgi:hypothetical protein